MNKKFSLLAAFLLPLLITLIVCIDHEVYPFGELCILHIDMYHQYCPFFVELMEKLKSGGSAFYSWNIGLGADFVSLYAYYLASPLNWLIILCPAEHVVEFMTILVVLKTSLCGLTFAYYLMEHFSVSEMSGEGKVIAEYAAAVFGTVYAVSAFMAAYAWNIMWTDCMVLAPLTVLGLERMVKKGRPMLYYVSLSVCILSNYYISIMVCIFLVLWFLFYWLEHRKSGFAAWLRFAGYSILAGGTGAVLILPTAIVLGYSGNQGTSFPETMEWYFSITAELGRQLALTEPYTGTGHWPNIYCGLVVLVFFVLYVLNGEISWKKKIPMILLAALFIVSFANNLLDFIWHGLHFPTSLPGRQTFLYAFVLLVLSYEEFLALKGNKYWHVAAALVVDAGFLVMAYFFSEEGMPDQKGFIANAVFLAAYLVLVLGYLAGNSRGRRLMLAVACLVLISEITLNYDRTGLKTVSRTAYVRNMEDYQILLADAQADAESDGVLFYRLEELERKTKNDSALYNFHSGTQFSSLMNLNVSHFYQDVGMEGGKNFYCAGGATPLFSAMLSIRYVLADNALEEGPLRTLVAQSGESWLYENQCVLPLGFLMSEDVIHAWNYKDYDDIETQNMLAWLLGSGQQMLVPVSSDSETGRSVCVADEAGYYYATYGPTGIESLTLEAGSGRTRNYNKVSHNFVLELGYFAAGEQMTVKNSDNEMLEMSFYRLNEKAMRAAFDALNQNVLDITSFSDSRVVGNITVEEAGRLIFSIAQEDGWTLYVDGRKQEPEMFVGAFMSVSLEPGDHEIVLRYMTPGFGVGAGISAGCILCFAACMVVEKRRQGSSVR